MVASGTGIKTGTKPLKAWCRERPGYGEDIESHGLIGKLPMRLQEMGSGTNQLPLFDRRHRGPWLDGVGITAVSDLDEYHFAPLPHDQVDFAETAAIVQRDGFEALVFEKLPRQGLCLDSDSSR
jgi:hypothetical protein